jgi:hypothetical protein
MLCLPSVLCRENCLGTSYVPEMQDAWEVEKCMQVENLNEINQ